MTEPLDFGQGEQLANIDLGAFRALCTEAWDARAECDLIEAQLNEKKKRFNEMLAKVQAFMEAAQLDKYHVPGYGLIYTVNRFSVSMPKDDNGKQQFFDYLKAKGIFDGMITVHSATLTAWYKKEMEAALDFGETDFKVPGISEAKYAKTLSMKKS